MSESTNLFKIVLVLGTVFLVVGLLPGFTTPQPWIDFKDQMSGQGFPVFNNPLQNSYLFENLLPAGPSPLEPPAFHFESGDGSTAQGTAFCNGGTPNTISSGDANSFKCIRTHDGDGSYFLAWITDSLGPNPGFGINMSLFSDVKVLSLIFNIWCKVPTVSLDGINATHSSEKYRLYFDGLYAVDKGPTFTCPRSDDYVLRQISIPIGFAGSIFNTVGTPLFIFADTWILNEGTPPFETVNETRFTYITIDVYSDAQPVCGGDSLAVALCQIGQLINNIVTAIGWFVGTIIYIFSIVAFIFLLIFNLVAGLIFMILWLYNIPGTPEVIQLIIDILITALLAWLIYFIIKLLKPAGGE